MKKGSLSKDRDSKKNLPPKNFVRYDLYRKGLLFLESLTTRSLLPLLNIETTLCAHISLFSPLTYIDIYLKADRLHSLQTHIKFRPQASFISTKQKLTPPL